MKLSFKRAIFCHELGHAMGLPHGSGSCMQNGPGTTVSYTSAERSRLSIFDPANEAKLELRVP